MVNQVWNVCLDLPLSSLEGAILQKVYGIIEGSPISSLRVSLTHKSLTENLGHIDYAGLQPVLKESSVCWLCHDLGRVFSISTKYCSYS